MTRRLPALLVLLMLPNLALTAAPASAKGAAPARTSVVRVAAPASVAVEARTLLETQAAAWNRGDLEAFCSVYADDALFLTAFGLTKGRAEVLERYRKRYPDAAARGTLSFEVLSVDVLTSGAAGGAPEALAVVARWRIAHADKPAAEGLTLLNLVRSAAGLRIVHDASM